MASVFLTCCVVLFIIANVLCSSSVSLERRFQIDYFNNTFLKDGKPFRYVSGSIHYSRVHPYYWKDRLTKMRAAGLNALQTYVPWNVHEMSPGQFNWEGASDLGRFLSLAQDAGFVVLLRSGPYICGEWEFGGFPAWLLSEDPNMIFRTSDPAYMKWVEKWFTELFTKVKPFLYENGGPIGMVQIENEYGSYFACDQPYLKGLKSIARNILGESVLLYTTDGAGDGYLRCGTTSGVYATVDFGVTYDPEGAFKAQRDYEAFGPLVNSEFYTGWLDHWGSSHSTTETVKICKSLDLLLAYGANINMYMFEGGTNFGFMNGANSPAYQPVPTSYDYDSPLSEAGDITLKYYAIRDIISKYLPLPPGPIPASTTKMKYGSIPMMFVSTVQNALPYLCPEGPVKTEYPVNMEKIHFYYGFVMYRYILGKHYSKSTVLHTRGVRDRAIVMVNGVPFGILEREVVMDVNITGSKGQALDILVENQGRVGFSTAMNFNTKGIIENVTLGGEMLSNWLMFPIHLENLNHSTVSALQSRQSSLPSRSSNGKLMTPSIYVGTLNIPPTADEPEDTYLDPRPWGKGQAIVNSFNIGRYWPDRGPQVTLYVPKPAFKNPPTLNQLYLFELEHAPCFQGNFATNCSVTFTDIPYIDAPSGPEALKKNLSWYNDPDLHLYH